MPATFEKDEDKVSLTQRRAELVESLAIQLPPEERVRIQGEISILNAKIKALNTTAAAQLKAAADRRKAAGLAEAKANAVRAQTKINSNGATSPDQDDGDDDKEDDDPGQTAAIDGWIDSVLMHHDVDFGRDAKGRLMVANDPSRRAPMDPNLGAVIEQLVAGVYAAARGQELPDLPAATPATKALKKTAARPKKH